MVILVPEPDAVLNSTYLLGTCAFWKSNYFGRMNSDRTPEKPNKNTVLEHWTLKGKILGRTQIFGKGFSVFGSKGRIQKGKSHKKYVSFKKIT